MKISIIGPSASGKTTLAKKLANKYKLIHVDLDYILFDYNKRKNRKAHSIKTYTSIVDRKSKEDNWIIEGVNPFKLVLDRADIIIWLRPRFVIALFNQWKRYFTDKKQRLEHGFKNNLKLSRYTVRQYYGNPTELTDPKMTWIKSVEKILIKYADKLYIIKNRKRLKLLEAKLEDIKS